MNMTRHPCAERLDQLRTAARHRLDMLCVTLSDIQTHDALEPVLETALFETRTAVEDCRRTLDEALAALSRGAEWQVFTVALYGETNAGKSTLIESLRLLLNEPCKRAERARFAALCTESQKDETTPATPSSDHKPKLATTEVPPPTSTTAHQSSKGWIERLKAHWQTAQPTQEDTYAPNKESASSANKSTVKQANLAMLETRQADMAACQDGAIIGNGASDFTRKTTRYVFGQDETAFALLDVPGIEGHDPRLHAEIDAALRQAHAVLYMTPKAAPPHQGEAGGPGTLALIGRQLADQSEVWSLFNKRVTHPRALSAATLIDADEAAGLSELDAQLRQQLGESYRGSLSLSALPAFYALADCLLPGTSTSRAQAKFRAALSVEVLLEKSGLTALSEFLRNELPHPHAAKISRANLRKADAALARGQTTLAAHDAAVASTLAALQAQTSITRQALDEACERARSALRRDCQVVLNEARQTLRARLHAEIERHPGQKAFARTLRQATEDSAQTISDTLARVVNPILVDAQKTMLSVVQQSTANNHALLTAHHAPDFRNMAQSMTPTLPPQRTGRAVHLASTLGGAALLAWNPAGWVLATVGAATLALGLYNSMRSLLSRAQRQAQQREAADATLRQMFDALETDLAAPLAALEQDLRHQANMWQNRLARPEQVLTTLRAELQKTVDDLSALRHKCE